MHSAWPAQHPIPSIHVASRFSGGIINRLRIWSEVRRSNSVICHITGDIYFSIIGLRKKMTVVTLHDLGMIESPNPVKRWLKRKLWLHLPLKHCNRVIAVSNETKEDILRRTSYPAEHIVVIPSVISPSYQRRSKRPENSTPQMLHIGLAENKNLDRHAAALAGLDIHLRIIGEPSEQQHAMLRSLHIDYSFASKLSESELQNEYASSDALLFCSTLEGFGMPIIEAQTIGLPVITSALAPMDDTAGNGALLVDPTNPEAIREAVLAIVNKPDERDQLIEKGHLNAERFSAAAAAQRHAELYAALNTSRD
ncbi:glycosyltransferase family 4 protein [Flavobacteriales bacterium]|nr:glycosyltransferase family 4 protein [Flavobacteriales bacterium]